MPRSVIGLTRLIVVALSLSTLGSTIGAAEFVGDLRMGSTTRMIVGRLAVKDSVYRMDLSSDEGRFFVIVNQYSGESSVFDPISMTYHVVPTLSPQSLQNDPFQALRFGDSIGVREFRGTDTVGRWICDRHAIRIKGNPVMVEWVARELQWPIRIKNLMAADSAFVEVVNIETGPVDREVFQAPPGFSLQSEPDGSGQEGGVTAGQAKEQPVDSSRAVEIGLVNLSDGESRCIIELQRGGALLPETEIGPISQRTFSFSGAGDQTRRIYSAAADLVIVRVLAGEIAVEITQPE